MPETYVDPITGQMRAFRRDDLTEYVYRQSQSAVARELHVLERLTALERRGA